MAELQSPYLHVFLHLLVFLLGRVELALGEGLPQGLLGHEGLQLQQRRHPAVLTDEARTVRTEVDCREREVESPSIHTGREVWSGG